MRRRRTKTAYELMKRLRGSPVRPKQVHLDRKTKEKRRRRRVQEDE